jgi:hypothetical protein
MSQTLLTRLARLEASRTTQKEALIIVGADQDECDARLKQAESSRQTTERKPLFILTGVPPLFTGGGDKADVEAKKAEMIRNGEASERDIFVVFKIIYEEPPEGRGWVYQ